VDLIIEVDGVWIRLRQGYGGQVEERRFWPKRQKGANTFFYFFPIFYFYPWLFARLRKPAKTSEGARFS